jgi:leucyl aminopeptidase
MAMSLPFVDRSSSSLPLQFVGHSKWGAWLKAQSPGRRGWIESLGISGAAGDLAVLPGDDGKASGAVFVIPNAPTLWDFGALGTKLPVGTWRLEGETGPVSMTDVTVAIGLGAWTFGR